MKDCDPYFLYNYAVELHLRGQYQRTMAIARECTNYWADYGLELLLGLKYSARYNPKKYPSCRYHEAKNKYFCNV